MFDCVLPTRLARNAALFTPTAASTSAAWSTSTTTLRWTRPAACHACTHYTAAYLHHLYRSGEILGMKLGSIHNVRFLVEQTERIRAAIADGSFDEAHAEFRARYRPVDAGSPVEVTA
jgi:queuine tRNA-ribosyltransferase